MKIDHTYIRDLILEELNALCEKSPGEHPYTVNFLQPGAPGVTARHRRAIVDAVSEDEAISKFKDRFPDAQRIVISEAKETMGPHDALVPALDKLEEDLLKLIDALPKMLKP